MASPLAIDIPPGYVKTDSVLAAAGRYVDGDNIRFFRKKPQKVGGNIALTTTAIPGGPIRGMHTWNQSVSRQLLAAGTAGKLAIIASDNYAINDITPADYMGGIINPNYGTGWGVGPWNRGAWNTPRPVSTSPFFQEATVWSFGNFGRILLASPSGQKLYFFDPATSPQVPAAVVAGAPMQNQGFWQTAERFTICYGCTGPNGETPNPLRIYWSAQGDYTDWNTAHTPAELAALPGAPAGSRTLQFGQRIVGAADFGNQMSLIWTDAALYTLQYVGGSFTFDSTRVGDRCGLLARYSFTLVGGEAYWISNGNFWMFSSNGVTLVPNADDISEWFFRQLDQLNSSKCFCSYVVRYDEVWFVIVPTGEIEPALAAVYNRGGQFWYHCSLRRSASTAFSERDPNPIYGGIEGFIHRHDVGLDNNGAPMPWYLTSPYLEIEAGASDLDVFGYAPDMQRQVGNVALEVNALDRTPGQDVIDTETMTFGPTDKLVDLHLAGREIQMILSCDSLGCDMRLGVPKVEYQEGGGRR